MRAFRRLTVFAVFGVLLSGVIGCSYHNDHGHDGRHDRDDVYVHEEDHHHHD